MPNVSRFQYQQKADPNVSRAALPVPALSWAPTYPDFAPSPVQLRWEGFVTPVQTALPNFPLANPVSFLPTFPDFARTAQPLVQEGWQIPQSTFQQNFEVITFDPANGFPWVRQPDFAPGPAWLRWAGFVTPVHPSLPSFPVPALSWNPAYPDFARGLRPLVPEGWSTPVHPSLPSFPVPALSWNPSYPDFARARSALQWEGWQIPASAFIQNFIAAFDPASGFPWIQSVDFARGRPDPNRWQGWITPVHPSLPSFPVPALSWAPQYPDFARTRLWSVGDYGQQSIQAWAAFIPPNVVVPKGSYIPQFRPRRR